jgi:hypothetical protein
MPGGQYPPIESNRQNRDGRVAPIPLSPPLSPVQGVRVITSRDMPLTCSVLLGGQCGPAVVPDDQERSGTAVVTSSDKSYPSHIGTEVTTRLAPTFAWTELSWRSGKRSGGKRVQR